MNQAYNHLIGTRIRSVRMQQKLSQEQLAAKAQLLGCDLKNPDFCLTLGILLRAELQQKRLTQPSA